MPSLAQNRQSFVQGETSADILARPKDRGACVRGSSGRAQRHENGVLTLSRFKTSLNFVENRVKNCANETKFKLIKGFFEQTLSVDPTNYGIRKARIIFIDADTFSSSSLSLEFCKDLICEGTYLILDDFYSYKGSNKKGVAGAFAKFRAKYNLCLSTIHK